MEEELIDRAIRGDKEALGMLVNDLKDEGYKVAYIILKNEDASIEAYLNAVEKVFRKVHQIREPRYFKTWFIRIIINEAKNIAKKNKRIVYIEEYTAQAVEGQDVCDKMDLETALQGMNTQVQEMIRLKFYLGYTLEEIAELLQMPVGTIKGKMYTALKNMREELEVKKYE